MLVFVGSSSSFDDPSVFPNFFCKFRKTSHVLLNRVLHVANFCFSLIRVCACTLLLFPVACRARAFAYFFLFPGNFFLSIFLLPLLRVLRWVRTCVRHQRHRFYFFKGLLFFQRAVFFFKGPFYYFSNCRFFSKRPFFPRFFSKEYFGRCGGFSVE